MPEQLKPGESEAEAGFNLLLPHRFDSGTERFDHIATAKKREPDDRAGQSAPVNAQRWKAEIKEEQLDEQRCVAGGFDVATHHRTCAGYRKFPDDVAQQTDQERAADRGHAQTDGEQKSASKIRQVTREERKIENHSRGQVEGPSTNTVPGSLIEEPKCGLSSLS